MSAAALLDEARSIGLALAATSERRLAVEWDGESDPPTGLLDRLKNHKHELLQLLADQGQQIPGPVATPALLKTEEELRRRIAEIEARLRQHPMWPKVVNKDWFTDWETNILKQFRDGNVDILQQELELGPFLFQSLEEIRVTSPKATFKNGSRFETGKRMTRTRKIHRSLPHKVSGSSSAAKPQEISPQESPPDWREFWEERAAIRQYDGGFTRGEAEDLALAEVLEAMNVMGLASDDDGTQKQKGFPGYRET